jgi:hypothetical protein
MRSEGQTYVRLTLSRVVVFHCMHGRAMHDMMHARRVSLSECQAHEADRDDSLNGEDHASPREID